MSHHIGLVSPTPSLSISRRVRQKARHRQSRVPLCLEQLENRITPSNLITLASFPALPGPEYPQYGVIMDSSGDLYGTASMGGTSGVGAVFEVVQGSNTVTQLASFDDTGDNGSPISGLTIDSSGNLYGATNTGGAFGDGTIYELPNGSNQIITLASFGGASNAPWGAQSGVIIDSSGNLYGTTTEGGDYGEGTVYELPYGTDTIVTLASFNGINGSSPVGGVIMDSNGNLYGAAGGGGANGDGTIFEIAAGSGTISTLASFDYNNGSSPYGGLVMDSSGNLYGTTQTGGDYGWGTVFELAAESQTITNLASFDGVDALAFAPLTMDSNGNLYGTENGSNNGAGGIFEVANGSGTISTLASFDGNNFAEPRFSNLVMDGAGNLYGTTAEGGAGGGGAVFELQMTGAGQTGTTTSVAASASPSVFGQSVTFTATVAAAAPETGTPTGTVTFMDGSSALGSGTLDSTGTATFSTSDLAVGSQSITAVYSGDSNFNGSNSPALSQTVDQDGTTAVIVSSANPSVLNQAVTFTINVSPAAPGSGTPTGTVQFQIDGANFGSAVRLVNGSATSGSISALTIGNHTIGETYSGDSNFTATTAPSVTQIVNKDNTTTSLAALINPSIYGQSVSLSASVTAVAPGSGTPTGSVTFYDGTTALGTATLSRGTATFKTANLPAGQDAITAVYSGNVTLAASTSAAVTQTVNQDGTTASVTSSSNSPVYGQSVTFMATVKANAPGSGAPTGTVTFMAGSTALASATLSSGKATFKTSTLGVGPYAITAVYSGDINFTTSTSSVLNQTVNQDATTTSVTSSPNPSVYGQTVTFTATVKAATPGSGTPTGTVTFMDGLATLGAGTLSGGKATFKTSGLAVGVNSITAMYGGDTNFITSTSPILAPTVNQDGTATKLTSSANPSVYGQSVTFAATVIAASPGSGTPTGMVTFEDGSTVLGTATLSDGVADFSIATLAVGTHSITAVYDGDTNFKTSTSAVLKQLVNA
jgi:uncharacterized repeat protein (TIGR03803 family)